MLGLHFNAVTKTYTTPAGPVHALRDFSGSFELGQVTWLRGNSGSGKSTVVRLAALLTDPTAGHVTLMGHEYRSNSSAARQARERTVGVVFQSNNLLSELTVEANLLVSRDDVTSARVAEVLEQLSLTHVAKTQAKALSGGEAQRVAIARAIIANVKVLVADEPTSGLDTTNADNVRTILRGLADSGVAVILASHDTATQSVADSIVTMERPQ